MKFSMVPLSNGGSSVILLGGRSVIGNAIVRGLEKRLGQLETVRISRSKDTREIELNDVFSEYLSDLDIQKSDVLVLSVGFSDHDLQVPPTSAELTQYLEKSVLLTYDFLLRLSTRRRSLNAREPLEVHLASSVLADFVDPKSPVYSLAKFLLESLIANWACVMDTEVRLFVWKFPFVSSPFHEVGDGRVLEVSTKAIERAVRKRSKPGTYYVPAFFALVSSTLHAFPKLVRYASSANRSCHRSRD